MTFAKDEANVDNNDIGQNRGRLSTDAIAGAGKADPDQRFDDTERPIANEERRTSAGSKLEPLFDENADRKFRDRWREIQTGFVDEPRNAVERADELVAELMQQLAQSFSKQRNDLEHQWDASDKVSTEELRVALTRYRSFFERLLSI